MCLRLSSGGSRPRTHSPTDRQGQANLSAECMADTVGGKNDGPMMYVVIFDCRDVTASSRYCDGNRILAQGVERLQLGGSSLARRDFLGAGSDTCSYVKGKVSEGQVIRSRPVRLLDRAVLRELIGY